MTKVSAVEIPTACQDGCVVHLGWPDGAKTLVKEHAFLDRVIRTCKAEDVRFFSVSASTDMEANAIKAVIKVTEDNGSPWAEGAFCRLLAEARQGPLTKRNLSGR